TDLDKKIKRFVIEVHIGQGPEEPLLFEKADTPGEGEASETLDLTASLLIPDDNPTATPVDTITITAGCDEDGKSTTVTVHNVDPVIDRVFVHKHTVGGDQHFTVGGFVFHDDGPEDTFHVH